MPSCVVCKRRFFQPRAAGGQGRRSGRRPGVATGGQQQPKQPAAAALSWGSRLDRCDNILIYRIRIAQAAHLHHLSSLLTMKEGQQGSGGKVISPFTGVTSGSVSSVGGKPLSCRQISYHTGTESRITQPCTPEPRRSCRGQRLSPACGWAGRTSRRYLPLPLLTTSITDTKPPNVPTAAEGQPENWMAGQPSNCSRTCRPR